MANPCQGVGKKGREAGGLQRSSVLIGHHDVARSQATQEIFFHGAFARVYLDRVGIDCNCSPRQHLNFHTELTAAVASDL
jgi:hypothetical protein